MVKVLKDTCTCFLVSCFFLLSSLFSLISKLLLIISSQSAEENRKWSGFLVVIAEQTIIQPGNAWGREGSLKVVCFHFNNHKLLFFPYYPCTISVTVEAGLLFLISRFSRLMHLSITVLSFPSFPLHLLHFHTLYLCHFADSPQFSLSLAVCLLKSG